MMIFYSKTFQEWIFFTSLYRKTFIKNPNVAINRRAINSAAKSSAIDIFPLGFKQSKYSTDLFLFFASSNTLSTRFECFDINATTLNVFLKSFKKYMA